LEVCRSRASVERCGPATNPDWEGQLVQQKFAEEITVELLSAGEAQ
jgi:hypothetical protein